MVKKNNKKNFPPLIQMNGLNKSFQMGQKKIPVLKDLSLRVEQGSFISVMGPSGSGKSSLMHILGCLDTPPCGSYWFDGQDISTVSDNERAVIRATKIGFVFQKFYLLSRLNVFENVSMPFRYSYQAKEAVCNKTLWAIEKVGLADRVGHKPTELSGGEMQRVAVARALVIQPKIILADEPTGNLDRKTGTIIMDLISDLNRQGTTIFLVTHDEQVAQKADKIMILEDGKLHPFV